MDAKELFERTLSTATREIMEVRDDFDQPTPDSEWSVYDLVSHMIYELAWVQDIVAGRRIEEVDAKYDGDLIGDDLQAAWTGFRIAAHDAVAAADLQSMVHVSYGDISCEEYLLQAGSDQAIHAWDLSQALGRPLVFDEALAEALYDYAETNVEAFASSGLFAPPLSVPDDAPLQDKLLAFYGRSDSWNLPA